MAAPTVDITNLNTEMLTKNDNVEAYKQKIISSCHNIFDVAQNALCAHPELRKVVIMEHAPRVDTLKEDPTGLKLKLATFANASFAQMWHNSTMKDNILIGKHSIDAAGDKAPALYKNDRTGRMDGIHFYGDYGKEIYTSSVSTIIMSALSFKASRPRRFDQKVSNESAQKTKPNQNIFSVPVNNRFQVLGN